MKKCPFCAEEIQDEAIKCRYCGEMLGTSRPATSHPGVVRNPGDPNLKTSVQLPSREFGMGVAALAVMGLIFALTMDVSVAVPVTTLPTGDTIGGGRVNNIGLMQDRQNYFMLSGLGLIVGIALSVVGVSNQVPHRANGVPDPSHRANEVPDPSQKLSSHPTLAKSQRLKFIGVAMLVVGAVTLLYSMIIGHFWFNFFGVGMFLSKQQVFSLAVTGFAAGIVAIFQADSSEKATTLASSAPEQGEANSRPEVAPAEQA